MSVIALSGLLHDHLGDAGAEARATLLYDCQLRTLLLKSQLSSS
jgi:hypothetical protein